MEKQSGMGAHPTPIAVIVDSCFVSVTKVVLSAVDANVAFERHQELRDDDLVCFEVRSDAVESGYRVFTHVGRVQVVDGTNRMLSKFGQGPVPLSDLNFPNRVYPGADIVRIYRYQEASAIVD